MRLCRVSWSQSMLDLLLVLWIPTFIFNFPQEIGCLIGALSNLWIGDRLGRRRTIVLGGVVMIIGAILQASSFGYSQILVARVITGLGNGLNVWLILFERDRIKNNFPDIHRAILPRRMFTSSSKREFDHDRRKPYHIWYYGFVSLLSYLK